MTSRGHKLTVSQLSLYNPSRLSDDEIIDSFAARQAVFERIVADVATEKPGSRAQHHLIVGQRGMGKSMLLARIAAELRQKPELSGVYVPLVFAEEQYAVDRLSKFWLNCLDSLADACERSGNVAATERIDEAVRRQNSRLGASASKDEAPAVEALEAFLAETKALGRRPVLLVDNLQLVFERLSDQQQHALREALLRPGGPLLVGASPSPPPESQDYGAAFYDHFKIHYLSALSLEEMRQLMLALAEKVGRPDVRDRVAQHPHRLSVLRQLTGGNPRTTVTLFFLYAEDFAPSVFGDLENLLDRVTPLYKARFEELSPQQQVVASAIANHWDPVTARTLSEMTGVPITGISPQLDRLEKTGFIERVELFGESASGVQIAERFFNIWFLMRSASRRQRREVEFLTRFIESFYEAQDRSKLARHLQTEHDFSADRHLFVRALGCTLDRSEARDLQRHADLDALRQKEVEARRRLEEVIDFTQLPPASLAFAKMWEKLTSLVPPGNGIGVEDFAEKVLGDRRMFQSGGRELLAARKELSAEEVGRILASINASRLSDEAEYGKEVLDWLSHRLSSGQLASRNDVEDWNATFRQAKQGMSFQILVDTLPLSVGCQLSEEVYSIIRQNLEPGSDARPWKWCNWAHKLYILLGRFKDAEAAYRRAIVLDKDNAITWNGLGNLLKSGFGRYEEAEAAYRKAIALDKTDAMFLSNLGILLGSYLGRYAEAEAAFRQAIARTEKDVRPWFNLGILLQDVLGRHGEAEEAYRQAIARDEGDFGSWRALGSLLHRQLGRYEEAEVAYRKAIAIAQNDAAIWNDLGELYCDHFRRLIDASNAFELACELDPTGESPAQNLVFLHRDFLGEGALAQSRLQPLLARAKLEFPDCVELHRALFAVYAENWGVAREALERALSYAKDGFPMTTSDDWFRASAVLLHLNCGESLLSFLRDQGADTRLRPWYEALAALEAGNRSLLQNLAPEVRTIAEVYFDQIEKRLNALPEKTRRRPVPSSKSGTRP